jgi:hypothetical protein
MIWWQGNRNALNILKKSVVRLHSSEHSFKSFLKKKIASSMYDSTHA